MILIKSFIIYGSYSDHVQEEIHPNENHMDTSRG